MKLRGFEVYRNIHPTNCAREEVLLSSKQAFHTMRTSRQTEEIQVTSFKINTTSGLLTVAALYSPTRHHLKRGDYVGGSKIFRTGAVKIIKLSISPIGRRHPRSSSLPHVDTGPTVSIFGTHPGSSFL